MSEIELKPCPFCGEYADLEARVDYDGVEILAVYVECSKCEVRTRVECYKDGMSKAKMDQVFEDAADLVTDIWNKRAIDDNFNARLRALESKEVEGD